MYIYAYTHTYIYIYLCVYIYTYVYINIYIYACKDIPSSSYVIPNPEPQTLLEAVTARSRLSTMYSLRHAWRVRPGYRGLGFGVHSGCSGL